MPGPKKPATILYETLKDKDLWMIKTIYLVYLLKLAGIDVAWILRCKDKQAIYEAIERLWTKLGSTSLDQGTKDDLPTYNR